MTRAPRRPGRSTAPGDADRFRDWLRDQLFQTGRSLNAIETAADMPGNSLGKFLRGERSKLTPLQLLRLSPVLQVTEEELLYRAGHLGRRVASPSVPEAIERDPRLDLEARRLLAYVYRRMREQRTPDGPPEPGPGVPPADRAPVMTALDHHPDSAPLASTVVADDGTYVGYFEDEFGCQALFTYPRFRGPGTLRIGQRGWEREYPVDGGQANGVTLSRTAARWLRSCWAEAIGESPNCIATAEWRQSP